CRRVRVRAVDRRGLTRRALLRVAAAAVLAPACRGGGRVGGWTTMRIAYGTSAPQFGELRLPPGSDPHPVVVLLHGGLWLSDYGLDLMTPLAEDLTAHGVATWNLEYRRLGDDGGGWPGTFLDVAAGCDHLRQLAPARGLDPERIVSLGHSAGGHLA